MKIYWSKEEGTKNIIGKKIKTLRKAAGITQKQLAEKLQLQGHEFSDLVVEYKWYKLKVDSSYL